MVDPKPFDPLVDLRRSLELGTALFEASARELERMELISHVRPALGPGPFFNFQLTTAGRRWLRTGQLPPNTGDAAE